jgi:hypothetical protein
MKLYKIMTQEGMQYAALRDNELISLRNGLSYVYENNTPVDMTLDELLDRQESQLKQIRDNLKYSQAYNQNKQEISSLVKSNQIIKSFKK